MPSNKINVIHSSEAPANVVTIKTTKKIIRRVPKGQGEKFKATDTAGVETQNKTNNSAILRQVGVTQGRNVRVSQKTRVTKTTTVKEHRVSQSKLTNWAAVDNTQRMSNEQNVVQVKTGQAVALEVAEKPLSQAWNRLNRIIPQMLFAFNLIVAVIDLALKPVYLYFKIPALIISVVENIILAGTWFFKKTEFYMNADENKKKNLDKQFQFLENVIQEVLLYPSLVITTFNVVVGRFYDPSDPQTVLEIILLIFDVIALIYVYGIRIYMTRKIMMSLKRQTGLQLDDCALCHVTTRFSIALAMNSVLFGSLLGMLALQIHTDNADSQDYTCSGWTVVMIIETLILPLFGLCVFCIVNYYWILEMFILINLNVSVKNDEIYDTAEEVEAPIAKTILEFTLEKTDATRDRLADIQKVTGSQKYFYALREWKCCLVLILYTGLAVLYGVAFNADFYSFGQVLRVGIVFFIALCNYQVASLVLVMGIYVSAIFISWVTFKCGLHGGAEPDEPLPTYDDKDNHVYASYRQHQMPDVA